jgi:hypothetical protein
MICVELLIKYNEVRAIPSITTWGSVTPVKLRTNPRIHGRDSVSRTNTIDTIELLYSYLAGMNGVAYTMHNVLCRSVTEARFIASSRSSGSHRNCTHLHGGIWRVFGDDRNRRVFGMGQSLGMQKYAIGTVANDSCSGKQATSFMMPSSAVL